MNFISRWFSKSPADLLAKGDKYLSSESYFEARVSFEDGLKLCTTDPVDDPLRSSFLKGIAAANNGLAGRNIQEAEFALGRGDAVKAADHLELALTQTTDQAVRHQAERLLSGISPEESVPVTSRAAHSSCGSCSGSSGSELSDSSYLDEALPPLEYYELLIHQLPEEQYQRYALLGEDFAVAYIAASRDHHGEALAGFEGCADLLPPDIYHFETGKVLHRLGRDREAERHLRSAIQSNEANSLAWLTLALMLRETGNLTDAMTTVNTMVSASILPEQALLLRADILEVTGQHESAINQYVELLATPLARSAGERLYALLQEVGRHDDAAVIFKKYLKKSCH